MTAAEPAAVRLCHRCRAPLDPLATYCTSCNSHTNWLQYVELLGKVSGTIAAVVALVVALNLKGLFELKRSDIQPLSWSCDRSGADLTAVNIGSATGILTRGTVRQYLIDRRGLDPALASASADDRQSLAGIADSIDRGTAGQAMRGHAELPVGMSMGSGRNDLGASSVALEADRIQVIRIGILQFRDTDDFADGIQPGANPEREELRSIREMAGTFPEAFEPRPDGAPPSPACITHFRIPLVDAASGTGGRTPSRLSFACPCPESQ